jgi:hypothetical protein
MSIIFLELLKLVYVILRFLKQTIVFVPANPFHVSVTIYQKTRLTKVVTPRITQS